MGCHCNPPFAKYAKVRAKVTMLNLNCYTVIVIMAGNYYRVIGPIKLIHIHIHSLIHPPPNIEWSVSKADLDSFDIELFLII